MPYKSTSSKMKTNLKINLKIYILLKIVSLSKKYLNFLVVDNWMWSNQQQQQKRRK